MELWYSFEFCLLALKRNVNLCIDAEAIISQKVWNKNEWVKCNIVNSLLLSVDKCIQNVFEAIATENCRYGHEKFLKSILMNRFVSSIAKYKFIILSLCVII